MYCSVIFCSTNDLITIYARLLFALLSALRLKASADFIRISFEILAFGVPSLKPLSFLALNAAFVRELIVSLSDCAIVANIPNVSVLSSGISQQ